MERAVELTGIIYHGSDDDMVWSRARGTAIEHMRVDAAVEESVIEKNVSAGTYPNCLCVKRSDEQSEISIESTRKIIEFLSQKRGIPGKLAVIVRNCDEMSKSAANAILKILEEPPSDAMVILTTTRLFSVLPTIRSRCLKIRVRTGNEFAISAAQDMDSYIRMRLRKIEPTLINSIICFIKSGCRDFTGFSKQNAEHMREFLEVAICYCSFLCFSTGEAAVANMVLQLQRLTTLALTTHPDGQAAILAACNILRNRS
ncbi:MAG: hypothetical protein LBF56_01635 [Holosporales bacterium]|jgi:hypothetical protein|nr:hypothetical protein [Holosporales bacterium]